MYTVFRKIKIVIENIFFFIVSLFFVKDKKIGVIGAWDGERYADNSRYLYLYVNNKKNDMKLYWITKNKMIYDYLKKNGLPVVMSGTKESFFIHLKAKYHIICQSYNDIDGKFSVRSIRINLWHGIPLKKIWKEKDYKNLNFIKRIKILLLKISKGIFEVGCWSKFYLLTTSNYTNKLFKSCLIDDSNKTIINVYPRVEYLKNPHNFDLIPLPDIEVNIINDFLKMKENEKIIVFYLPTFRDNSKDDLFGEKNEEFINKVLEELFNNNIEIVIKPHFASKCDYSKFKNIYLIDSYVDIYSILRYVDILITDYSSIYMDFLVLNKPIIFFPYDYNEYKNNDRGFLMDYEKNTPGEKVYNILELKKILINLKNNNLIDNYEKERKEFEKKLYGTNTYELMNILRNGEV